MSDRHESYRTPPTDGHPEVDAGGDYESLDGLLAIRRHTDRCFFRAEEVTPEGYIVDGVLIPYEDVAEVREAGGDAACNL